MTESLREMGFEVVDSQANFVLCTHDEHAGRTDLPRAEASGILVRYMQYPGWGDGLRITVGTDEQVDACLGMLQSLV